MNRREERYTRKQRWEQDCLGHIILGGAGGFQAGRGQEISSSIQIVLTLPVDNSEITT